jgi:hypothetical protein
MNIIECRINIIEHWIDTLESNRALRGALKKKDYKI